MNKICKNCGNIFWANHSVTDYCSKKCAGAVRRYIEDATCQKCGKVFRKRQRKTIGKFCSAECAGTPRNGNKIRKCQYCGKEDLVVASKSVRKFCSPQCAYKGIVHHFTDDGIRRLRESKLGMNNWNYKDGHSTKKDGEKFYQTGEWKKLRKNCFIRDGFRCQKCMNVFEIGNLRAHHIIYRINGGSDNVNNLITYCLSCHSKEHHRLDREHKRKK